MELSAIDNPYDNSLSFDSFGDALLATMQLVILDNWEDVYKKVSDCNDKTFSLPDSIMVSALIIR